MKYKKKIRILLGIGLKVIPVSILAKNLVTFYPWPASCQEAEFKGERLIDLSEEISNQSKI